ncbi:hypothetical protein GSI_10336 [Ganoderma sinense ZZ0214-1]|uniref:DUF6534 domain-containing protein n=1 Tax=Ganoderma sinense ZZ0214-1 TaxID=1077348 RepID=A0A2G8S090_9APHY|nr:hypothetical protein GSI_10336 [Ganoderma sinense ZZ0214-1]
MIVAGMIWALLKGGYPKFKSSRRMVFRLLIITVNTGFWTAVFAIIDLALIVPFPNQLYWCAVDFPLTSLYLNALLANLNTREYIFAPLGEGDYNTYPMDERTSEVQLDSFNSARTGKLNPSNVQVRGKYVVFLPEC